jgi:hypothetical protein
MTKLRVLVLYFSYFRDNSITSTRSKQKESSELKPESWQLTHIKTAQTVIGTKLYQKFVQFG